MDSEEQLSTLQTLPLALLRDLLRILSIECDNVSASSSRALTLLSLTLLLGRECIVEMESESVRGVSVEKVAQIVAKVAQNRSKVSKKFKLS